MLLDILQTKIEQVISITSSLKLKPGIFNKLKSLLIADKNLWDFLNHDPKVLAYYLSAFLMIKKPEDYNISTNLINTISMISGEAFDDSENTKRMEYTEPEKLLDVFQELKNLSDEIIQKIINDNLNPEKISIKEVRDVVLGLMNYLKFQNTRGMLIMLEWF